MQEICSTCFQHSSETGYTTLTVCTAFNLWGIAIRRYCSQVTPKVYHHQTVFSLAQAKQGLYSKEHITYRVEISLYQLLSFLGTYIIEQHGMEWGVLLLSAWRGTLHSCESHPTERGCRQLQEDRGKDFMWCRKKYSIWCSRITSCLTAEAHCALPCKGGLPYIWSAKRIIVFEAVEYNQDILTGSNALLQGLTGFAMSGWRAEYHRHWQSCTHTLGPPPRCFSPGHRSPAPSSLRGCQTNIWVYSRSPCDSWNKMPASEFSSWSGISCPLSGLATYFQTYPCLRVPAFEQPILFICNENLNWIWLW